MTIRFIVCPVLLLWTSVAGAAEPDKAAIRSRLQQAWEAVGTLEASGEEFSFDKSGQRLPTHRRFDYKYTAEGCRVIKLAWNGPEGTPKTTIWYHEDGRKLYSMETFPDSTTAIKGVRVTNQTDQPAKLRSLLLSFLWMWTPRGVPLYQYLDAKSEVNLKPGAEASGIVLVKTESDGIPLRFELDPAHDYLPLVVELADFQIRRTHRFERVTGIWLPVEGEEVEFEDHKEKNRTGFVVRDIHINRPLARSLFEMPKIEDGVIVYDESGGKSFVKGGVAAHDRLEAKHGPDPSRAVAPTVAVNVASVEPDQGWWRSAIAVVSVLVIVVAIAMKLHQQRQSPA